MAAVVPVVKRAAVRRRGQRDNLWPDAATVVFKTASGGWAQMPRTVPMIASLIDVMGGKDNAGRLYVTLWSYEYGDGFVEVPDPVQVALEAGYLTNRAERTFNERIAALRELGFLRSAPVGMRDHGFLLLLDPHAAVVRLRKESPSAIPERWWTAFVARCANIGVALALD
jgi:hypothetical protein